MPHIPVRDLPQTLQTALRSLGFNKKDISIEPRETYQFLDYGSNGSRSFVSAVNLATGDQRTEYGSWGGPNPFSAPPVDRDDKPRPIPPGMAIIEGSEGGGHPTRASVRVHPSTMAPMLPALPEVSARDAAALYAYQSLKAGDYRQEELKRAGVTQADLDSLVSRGLLSRNAAGATKITTEGKNARAAFEAAERAKRDAERAAKVAP